MPLDSTKSRSKSRKYLNFEPGGSSFLGKNKSCHSAEERVGYMKEKEEVEEAACGRVVVHSHVVKIEVITE